MNYEEYEKKCKEVEKQNTELLEIFREDLKGLAPKTIQRHISNVDFFLNTYLMTHTGDDEPASFEQGIYQMNDFFGWFFIRKCMWSTPATIKSTAASIKKFYKSMLNHGKIDQSDYEELCDDLKYGMPEWTAMCAQYNDPDQESPYDSWFGF